MIKNDIYVVSDLVGRPITKGKNTGKQKEQYFVIYTTRGYITLIETLDTCNRKRYCYDLHTGTKN